MIVIVLVAALVTGLFLGWILNAFCEAASGSRSQDRMRSRFLRWQAQQLARPLKGERALAAADIEAALARIINLLDRAGGS